MSNGQIQADLGSTLTPDHYDAPGGGPVCTMVDILCYATAVDGLGPVRLIGRLTRLNKSRGIDKLRITTLKPLNQNRNLFGAGYDRRDESR